MNTETKSIEEIKIELEVDKLRLENDKIQYKIDILNKELQIKDRELNHKIHWWKSLNVTALAAIIAALIAFMGNLMIERHKHYSTLSIQEKKNQAALILEAAKTLDTQKATKMLEFFIETGLIENKEVKEFLREKGNIFETITVWGKDGILRPGLSKNWAVSPDLLNWVITLKEGIVLNDGRLLTSFILKEILEEQKIPNIKKIEFVKGKFYGFETIDNLKLRIILEKPDNQFIERLSVVKIPINKN